jgi:hypothetical protein
MKRQAKPAESVENDLWRTRRHLKFTPLWIGFASAESGPRERTHANAEQLKRKQALATIVALHQFETMP